MTEFSALYARHSGDVFRFALYLSGDRNEAADITSETFVRAWTAPGELRMSTVKGYLLAIARNVYLKSLRRSRRHVEIDETLRESLSDPAPGPQALAERSAEWDVAMRGLQRLSEIDRTQDRDAHEVRRRCQPRWPCERPGSRPRAQPIPGGVEHCYSRGAIFEPPRP